MPLDRIPGSMLSLLTPSQFDDSLQPATTDFVQRALGNARGFETISVATTLTAAHVGKVLRLTGSGYAVTLPAANSVAAGAMIYAYNGGSAVSFARAGSDTIDTPKTSSTSVTVGQNDNIILVSNGSNSWGVISGSASLAFSDGVFGSSLAGNGYQKLPSGLLIQWGQTAVINTTGTVTFPIAFPNALYSLQVCSNNSTAATTTAGTYSRTLSNFILRSARTDLSFDYIAIGS